jgi:hypothetical protein
MFTTTRAGQASTDHAFAAARVAFSSARGSATFLGMLPDSPPNEVLLDSPGLRPSWQPWEFFHSRMVWADPITSRRELRKDWIVPPPQDAAEVIRVLFGPDYFLDELWGPSPIWLNGVPDLSAGAIQANLTSAEAWIVRALFGGSNAWPSLSFGFGDRQRSSDSTVGGAPSFDETARHGISTEDSAVLRTVLGVRNNPDRALELVQDLLTALTPHPQPALSPVAGRAIRDWSRLCLASEHGRPEGDLVADLRGVAGNLVGDQTFWIPGDWGQRIADTIAKLVPVVRTR